LLGDFGDNGGNKVYILQINPSGRNCTNAPFWITQEKKFIQISVFQLVIFLIFVINAFQDGTH
jgi:hypothetical protein